MSEPTNTMRQPNPIDAIRTLLQTFQGELDTFAELSAGAVELLAELERPLGLVDFSPFAGLTGDEAAARQPAQPMPRPRRAAPVVNSVVTPPFQPPVAPTEPEQKGPMPVFTLPGRPPSPMRAVTVTASTSSTQDGAAISAAPHSQDSAEAAALWATMTMVDTLTDTLLTAASFADDQPTPPRSASVSPDYSASWPASGPISQANLQMLTSFAVDHGQRNLSAVISGAGVLNPGDTLTTMALLTKLTDTLLTTAPRVDAKPAIQVPDQAGSSPSPMPTLASTAEPHSATWPTTPNEDRAQTSLRQGSGFIATPPAVGTLPAPDFSPVTEGTWPSATAAPFGEPSVASLNAPPLDAWTLAQLINDVLAEEARRHGVDLS